MATSPAQMAENGLSPSQTDATNTHLPTPPQAPNPEPLPYYQRLVEYSRYSSTEGFPFGKFSDLQRQNIVFLQNELAKVKGQVTLTNTTSKEQAEALVDIMHKYVDAVRDLEYMSRLSTATLHENAKATLEVLFPDIAHDTLGGSFEKTNAYYTTYLTLPSKSQQKLDVVRDLLRRILPVKFSYSDDEKRENYHRYYRREVPTAYSKVVNYLADSVVATALAIGGGASLIVPMVIMALNPSLTKSLVTTSAAVVAFAFVVGFVDRRNVLGLTTAYAAVLVVFVGTSGTPQTCQAS